MEQRIYATIPAGSVEYDKRAARVDIGEFIEDLQQAQRDGATHVLGLSGNYRGAQWVRLGTPEIDDEETEDIDPDEDPYDDSDR